MKTFYIISTFRDNSQTSTTFQATSLEELLENLKKNLPDTAIKISIHEVLGTYLVTREQVSLHKLD